jgi:hypothetical protein
MRSTRWTGPRRGIEQKAHPITLHLAPSLPGLYVAALASPFCGACRTCSNKVRPGLFRNLNMSRCDPDTTCGTAQIFCNECCQLMVYYSRTGCFCVGPQLVHPVDRDVAPECWCKAGPWMSMTKKDDNLKRLVVSSNRAFSLRSFTRALLLAHAAQPWQFLQVIHKNKLRCPHRRIWYSGYGC